MAVQQTVFRGALDFFAEIGVYDVVLPFLLVFTIVFAVLEKTRILGVEKVHDHEYSKKPLNAVIAFVVAFLVVASSRLVSIINEAMANVVLLLLVSICFLLLIGSFYKYEENVFLEGGWRTFFMILMFIGVLLIFLHALGWLQTAWWWLLTNWTGDAAGAVVLLVVVIAFIYFITMDTTKKATKKEE
jgi:hypothetical protein